MSQRRRLDCMLPPKRIEVSDCCSAFKLQRSPDFCTISLIIGLFLRFLYLSSPLRLQDNQGGKACLPCVLLRLLLD